MVVVVVILIVVEIVVALLEIAVVVVMEEVIVVVVLVVVVVVNVKRMDKWRGRCIHRTDKHLFFTLLGTFLLYMCKTIMLGLKRWIMID